MRILHTMLRVTNLERSLAFYTEVLGMKLLRTSENAEYKYTLAFVGFSDEREGAVLELTCLLYTSPSPRDKRQSRMPSSA